MKAVNQITLGPLQEPEKHPNTFFVCSPEFDVKLPFKYLKAVMSNNVYGLESAERGQTDETRQLP